MRRDSDDGVVNYGVQDERIASYMKAEDDLMTRIVKNLSV